MILLTVNIALAATKVSVFDSFTIGSPTTIAPSVSAPAPTSSLVVNVKDKGAKGDGKTNDTAAIQAAINQVAGKSKQVAGKSKTVLVPAGIYMIDALTSLKLKSNMTFQMESGAVLKAITNSAETYNIIMIESVSNVNVIGGTLQGERATHTGSSGEWGMGLSIYDGHNIVIDGVTAKDCWGDGFYQAGDAPQSTNITLRGVVSDNNRRQGLSIENVDGMVVQNSIFKNTNGTAPMAGIDIEPFAADQNVSNVQILNSQFLNNQLNGVEINGTFGLIANVTVDGNTMKGSLIKSGIGIYNTSGHRITNNLFINNKESGIVMENGSSNTVTGNKVTNNGHIGVLMLDRSTKNTITNNTVIGKTYKNIVDNVGGNTINGNTGP